MKLVMCIICLSIHTCALGKKIKIQVDTDDIVKILSGFINHDTFSKFMNQIVLRSARQYGGYGNPYHPEDDLVNRFDEAMDKEKIELKNKPEIINEKDPLDKENENFILEATSHDELTDNESGKNSTVNDIIKKAYNSEETNKVNKKANLHDNSMDNVKLIESRKDTRVGDTSNFKPLQKRFLLKYSGGN